MSFLEKLNEFVEWLPNCKDDKQFNLACMQLQAYFKLDRQLDFSPDALATMNELFAAAKDGYVNKKLAAGNMNTIILQINSKLQSIYRQLNAPMQYRQNLQLLKF